VLARNFPIDIHIHFGNMLDGKYIFLVGQCSLATNAQLRSLKF